MQRLGSTKVPPQAAAASSPSPASHPASPLRRITGAATATKISSDSDSEGSAAPVGTVSHGDQIARQPAAADADVLRTLQTTPPPSLGAPRSPALASAPRPASQTAPSSPSARAHPLRAGNSAALSSSDEDGYPRSVTRRARPSVGVGGAASLSSAAAASAAVELLSSSDDDAVSDAQRRRVLRQATLAAVCKARAVDAAQFYAPIQRRVSLTRELLMRPAYVCVKHNNSTHRRTYRAPRHTNSDAPTQTPHTALSPVAVAYTHKGNAGTDA